MALRGGLPVAVFEKSGAVLRVFAGGEKDSRGEEADGKGETFCGAEVDDTISEVLKEFIKVYTGKKIFTDKKRLTVKQFPPEAEAALQSAGFKRVMMDYVAYAYPTLPC